MNPVLPEKFSETVGARDVIFVEVGSRFSFLPTAFHNDGSYSPVCLPEESKLTQHLFENALPTYRPAAILIGRSAAERNDFRLLRVLSSRTESCDVPVLVLDDTREANVTKLLAEGADDVYGLPTKFSAIRERIRFLIAQKSYLRCRKPVSEQSPKSVKVPFGKRMFDLAFAGTLLLLLFPLFVVVAVAIMIEDRNTQVFYKSQRVGTDYRIFDFLKFRSMYKNADQQVAQLMQQNNYGGSKDGAVFFKMRNDPRVTKVGRVIRKYSIDELPQLVNVLRGEMSIVGNRPLPLREAEQLTRDGAVYRFLAPAGLTGLWQIAPEGKDNVTPERRIELDVEYSQKFTLWNDMKIIAKTIPAVVQGGEGKTDKKKQTGADVSVVAGKKSSTRSSKSSGKTQPVPPTAKSKAA